MVGKRSSGREELLVIEGFLVSADTLVEFLFPLFLNGTVGQVEDAFAQEANVLVIALVF